MLHENSTGQLTDDSQSTEPNRDASVSRRDFALGICSATALLPICLTPHAALADEPKKDEPKKNREAEPLNPIQAEAVLWLELILARYPDPRLTPEVMKLVAGDVLGDVFHCRRVSSFSLKNSDSPAFEFSARIES